ncbi:minor capsid protein [Faecalicatena contorta]|uniref:minor capsid protein n=2 Tax=Faecalicatena contorta TaxID=39482 RepID=UPI001565B359|nr:minor capsid protein [Faecalicatena contorta]
MDNKEYWRKREEENLKHNIKTEAEYLKTINSYYDYMMDQIQKEINGFYAKYAKKEGITLAEAKKRVSEADIKAYERKAAKYVKEKNFSAEANAEMRLYNATMKINRLEMLKANIGLELVDGFDGLQKYFDKILTKRTLDELERQAGILGKTIHNNAKAAHSIVNASFHNAKFSDRIWMYQDMLKAELSNLLQIGMIQGRNPRVLARHLEKRFGVSKADAERLMRTELARVQTEAQKQSFEWNGFTKYEFIALGSACGICREMDGKHFDVEKMMPGTNAPPMHPNCVLPDTKIIAPDMEAMMKSEYLGDVIEIGTSNGTRLTVTPNHIVLTARGWCRAKNLIKGDKVVYYSGRTEPMIKTNPADDNSVITAEQLFTALIKSSSVSAFSVPVSAKDLKSDVVPDSKVDVVFIDSKLRGELDSSTKKFISDILLVRASVGNKRSLPANRTLAELLVGISLASDGIMSGNRVAEILFGSTLTHRELISLRLPSDYDTRLNKTAAYDASADAKLLGYSVFADSGVVQGNDFSDINVKFDSMKRNAASFKTTLNSGFCDIIGLCNLISAFAGVITFDDVVFVSNKFYSGHVYDASSLSTLYISNGIITSNCRCSVAAWEDDEEYEAWLDFLNKGGTTEEWERLKKNRKTVEKSSENGTIKSKNATSYEGIPKKWKTIAFVDNVLKNTNPGYYSGDEKYKTNCTNCVSAYEMRQRGYDVVAKASTGNHYLERNPEEAWVHPEVEKPEGSGLEDILNAMKQLPDGSRVEIAVKWKNNASGHVFVAEKKNEKVYFFDVQSGEKLSPKIFDRVQNGETRFWRIDNLEPSDRGITACEVGE